ncbi:Diguanylate cyclase [Lentibacillus sp. JNUCC-1]|nr:Diguanylate cyclase [Lentibacillus sp. JNUCC-1]
MTCDICNPKPRGYTIYFSEDQHTEQLTHYFKGFPETEWTLINNRMFWTVEPVFFGLMDYIEAHLSADDIFAVEASREDPIRTLNALQPIRSFQETRAFSWIDGLIQNRRIQTYYQPIVAVKNNVIQIVGNELLSRGVNEHNEMIPPFKMFEAARKRNRLFALDRVCRMESINNAKNATERLIFINFIPTAIYVPEHCLATTFALIKKLDIRPEQVVFEVVETDKVQDIEHLKSILSYYRKHGFKYALDDVGTGFNGPELIADLQPDFVKLALEYTNGVSKDAEKKATAEVVLKMAHDVGAQALAEGVERKEDLDFLNEMGYDLYQGYYFAKPGPEPLQDIKIS